ncbi:MAG: HU family DNA-binding protein [Chromatiales bacterium]|jgi:nucleoid DNA-binding protein|nr:HU family DNA-binding protein [Chromatiales bacterium]MDX9767420.1 HU family DNA-binding protein [Ectothiorhodospiraceae bacterium]
MAATKKAAAPATPKAPTKSEILSQIAAKTGLAKKDVSAVFDSLSEMIGKNLKGSKAPGTFVMPGLLKIKVIKKPATKARKGINPFTGEETVFKAKPARRAVKIQPLKNLKDMA